MFKFNNNHIFTGYLKQLLASFNLPKCRVYTEEQQKFAQERTKKLIELQQELDYFEPQLADNNKFLAECQEELKEIQNDLLILDQKALTKPDLKKYMKSNSRLITLKVAIQAAKAEIEQLQDNKETTAETLEAAITSLEKLKQEQITTEQTIAELLAKARAKLVAENDETLKTILETEAKLTDIYNEKAAFNLQDPIIRLQEEIQKYSAQELNVIPTVYHSTFPVYPGTIPGEDIPPLVYPEKLRYIPYIKDGFLQVYTDDNWHNCHATFANDVEHKAFHKSIKAPFATIPYTYGKRILNYTKNLKIQNTIYDSYTHEYLGDYLRFHRDFANINLMPLYNCFSNRACPHLDVTFTVGNNYEAKFKTDQSFETSLYKYYMVPVKFFKDYTIAIDSEASIEVCCCIYDEYHDSDDDFANVPQLTYQCFSDMQFKTPQLYTGVQKLNSLLLNPTPENTNDLCQQEENLKLILKVPINNKSSIVILEGDYTTYNDSLATFDPKSKAFLATTHNKTIINYENLDACDFLADKLITPLQLLRTNTGESYPFADRLVEYLTGNAITTNETIKDNVVRAKTVIKSNCADEVYSIEATDGVWEPILQCLVYDYINKNPKTNTHDINHDILGFIDKDVEKWYATQTKNGTETTIANVDLYE